MKENALERDSFVGKLAMQEESIAAFKRQIDALEVSCSATGECAAQRVALAFLVDFDMLSIENALILFEHLFEYREVYPDAAQQAASIFYRHADGFRAIVRKAREEVIGTDVAAWIPLKELHENPYSNPPCIIEWIAFWIRAASGHTLHHPGSACRFTLY
jgi:hypothetical protein